MSTSPMAEAPSLVKPVVRKLFDGQMRLRAYPKVAQCIPEAKEEKTFQRIMELARMSNLSQLMIPQFRFTNQICDLDDLKIKYRDRGITVKTGAIADGLLLRPDWAGVIPSADCPTIAMWGAKSGCKLMLHGGRDALINQEFVEKRYHDTMPRGELEKSRRSIVHSAINLLKAKGDRVTDIHLSSVVGIAGPNFAHNRSMGLWYEHNLKMAKYLNRLYGQEGAFDKGDGLHLHLLIELQATHDGIPPEQISHDEINTFDEEWASKRRNPSEMCRNVIFMF